MSFKKVEKTDFDYWYEDIEEIADKGILLVKNGLEYNISLTTNKKPELKKQQSKLFPKGSLRKKYEVTGVNLLRIETINQKEIDEITTKRPSEEKNYENIALLQYDTTYTLKLTPQQYKILTHFMQKNSIMKEEAFYFRRYGSELNTYFKFFQKSQVKTKIQKSLGAKK